MEEKTINPSTNLDLKKQYQEEKKTEKKIEKTLIKQGVIPDPSKQKDDYDFGVDFWSTTAPTPQVTDNNDNKKENDEDLEDVDVFAF